jgi:aspartyl/glutamyl-tRNA(Asn/Gln) amidotransferase C subunit
MSDFSPAVVAHISQLANLPVTTQEQESFAVAFEETLQEVSKINVLDVSSVQPTAHTTGLTNVWREDVVDAERVIPQELVLGQAEKTFKSYILVDRVIEENT